MSLNDAITSLVVGIFGIVVVYVYLVYASKATATSIIPKKKTKR